MEYYQMTGLDLTKDCIIESAKLAAPISQSLTFSSFFIIRYAAIVTDGQLEPLDDGISFVIQADKALLDGMDEW